MPIDLAGIGSLVSVLTGLLVTVGGLMLQRQRRQVVDADDMEDELEVRTVQWTIALRFIRALEEDRAAYSDLPPLARPPELQAGYLQERLHGGKRKRAGRHAAPADDPGAKA